MLEIDPKLKEDFERWVKKINGDFSESDNTISILDVLRAHYLIVDYFMTLGQGIGGVGPRDLNLLYSTVGRQSSSYGGINKWGDNLDLCATLFFGIIKNHPFFDGNKRTSLLTLLYHLWKIGRTPSAKQRDFENLALNVASNTLSKYPEYRDYEGKLDSEVKFISRFLRKNTRVIDTRNYMITYHQLNHILQKFDYRLDNPSGNNIDVIQQKKQEKWNFFRLNKQSEIIENRVGVIAFPGWTREVGKSEISKVRKLTNLTAQNGIDAEVFFRGATPLEVLIERYKTPLERLARK